MSKLLLLSAALLFTFSVVAQDRVVTGKVTSSEGPLPGTNVLLKGTPLGTTTDADGNFSLTAPPEGVLVFSFIGFKTQEVAVGNKTTINISLEADQQLMAEVLVVGYGTQSKAEFTGSATRVSASSLQEIPVQSFDQALIGRAAGVQISLPNGVLNNAPVIRVRGVNSISQSSYPLIVIDGIPVTAGDNLGTTSVPNNPLADINPSDIESIDVLKDAASTSIYGSRGANGVILVTTKRGKEGKAKVTYDAWVGWTTPVRLPELLKAEQYMEIKNEARANANQADAFFPSFNADGSLVDTKWYDQIFQTGVSHNHAVSVSGGTAKTQYFFSTNLSRQQGILQTNEFDRQGMRFNVNHEVNDWLKLTGGINYTKSENRSPNSGSLDGNAQGIIGAARMAWTLAPNVPVYNADGTPHLNFNDANVTIGNGANTVVSVYYNPVTLFKHRLESSANDRILANFGATLTLAKGLTFTTNYSADRLIITNKIIAEPVPGSSGYSTRGSISNINSIINNTDFANTLQYETRFGLHHISALAGSDVQEFSTDAWGANVQQAADPYFVNYQGTWGQISATGNSLSDKAFLSYFGRLNYDFKSRYFLTINFRRDGNSSLGFDKKWGNFGGVSAGWTLSEEEFFKSLSVANTITSLKLRGSWGRVGNGNLSPYASLDLYSAGLYGASPTLAINQAGNPNLGWETGDQTNIGFDLGLLNDRLQVDFSYFNNNVNGLILSVPQAASKGIPGNSIVGNVGSLYNRGIEIAISGEVIRKAKFSWNASVNFTNVKNEVTALASEGARIVSNSSGNPFNMTQVGYSVGTLFGAVTNGVNPVNGRRIYINREGREVQYSLVVGPGEFQWSYLDGSRAAAITAADYQPLGNALPKWYGGFNNTFKYGNFDFAINFAFSGGNYVLNGNTGTWLDQRYFNNSTKVLDRWQEAGDITDVPRLVYGDNFASANIPNISAYVEKGDFLRLQNLMAGYKLPSALLSKASLTSARVYVQATNVFLFTKYTGVEPESSINGNRNTSPGIEYNSLGNGRTITVGVNLGL
ncbi:MAG TPA: SusC/RagA family TonB-linked outer membrane protein [Cytophagales bacterium]|nr:SusC/RagA family TonB-linked outer membrane protein [Cytophagales bacterium]HRG08249.1 TonB-dependent receptor [Cyclobacteriaceae bacterium]